MSESKNGPAFSDEAHPQVTAEELKEEDVDALRNVLEGAIRYRHSGEVIQDELEEVIASLKDALATKNGRTYFVVHNPEGAAIGVMGFQAPDEILRRFATTDNPVEIINAFVAQDQKGLGIGGVLADRIEDAAKTRGFSEVIVSSGPRYEESGGWAFWTKRYGKPVGTAENYYGGQYPATVWRKQL